MFRNALVTLTLLLLPVTLFGDVQVLVTIKPLQLVTEAVLGDHGTVTLLMPAGSSPHHYTLSPADRRAIEAADLIVYVGEELETQFDSIMQQLKSSKNVLELLSLESLNRIPLDNHGHAETGTDAPRYNPHIWLDPDNALVIAAAIRDRLGQLQASQATALAENYRRFEAELTSQAESWSERLQNVDVQPFAVYHNATDYFERRFNVAASVVLVEDTEEQPGIREILARRQAIKDTRPVCLFTDRNASQATINTMLSDYQLRSVQLDLLGERVPQNQGYVILMGNLVNDFTSCF